MKLPIRILIAMLCAAIILSMPFTLSSPRILDNEKARLMQEMYALGEQKGIEPRRLRFKINGIEE